MGTWLEDFMTKMEECFTIPIDPNKCEGTCDRCSATDPNECGSSCGGCSPPYTNKCVPKCVCQCGGCSPPEANKCVPKCVPKCGGCSCGGWSPPDTNKCAHKCGGCSATVIYIQACFNECEKLKAREEPTVNCITHCTPRIASCSNCSKQKTCYDAATIVYARLQPCSRHSSGDC